MISMYSQIAPSRPMLVLDFRSRSWARSPPVLIGPEVPIFKPPDLQASQRLIDFFQRRLRSARGRPRVNPDGAGVCV